jgi:hypothetical protein
MQSLALPKASEANPHPKIVVVLDSIVSNPGVLLPWQEMVKICKEVGAWSVIDAAHSLGQEKTNLAEVQPDFWVSVSLGFVYSITRLIINRDNRTATNGSSLSEDVRYSTSPNGASYSCAIHSPPKSFIFCSSETDTSLKHHFLLPTLIRRSILPFLIGCLISSVCTCSVSS